MKIAFIGGGKVGGNLANLFVTADHDVVVGLRDLSRARADATYRVAPIADAVAHGDVIVLALHYAACASAIAPLASALADKIVVDATNPLKEDWSPMTLGQENSGGEENARLLPSSRVVKAFNTIFADMMNAEKIQRGGGITAFIAGDESRAKDTVVELANSAGFTALDTGPLKNARYLEAMAHLNIQIAVGRDGGTDAAFLYRQKA